MYVRVYVTSSSNVKLISIASSVYMCLIDEIQLLSSPDAQKIIYYNMPHATYHMHALYQTIHMYQLLYIYHTHAIQCFPEGWILVETTTLFYFWIHPDRNSLAIYRLRNNANILMLGIILHTIRGICVYFVRRSTQFSENFHPVFNPTIRETLA